LPEKECKELSKQQKYNNEEQIILDPTNMKVIGNRYW
jgi:hypothetical protein